MPELPEVEAWRKLAERHVRGKTIAKVTARKDEIIFDQKTHTAWARACHGLTVNEVCRKGKHLWMDCGAKVFPYFHFGMSGAFHVYQDESERDKYLKAEFLFEDGTRLGYRNARRIGAVRLLTDPLNEEPISKLGFDPFLNLPSLADFSAPLRKRRAPIKSILLDQKFAAGVGNWIADEILYQAKIHPRKLGIDLSDDELKRLRSKMKSIIDKSVAVDADKARFPKTWLFHYRWGKSAETTAKGEPIEFDRIGGRTTAWVPSVQT